MKRMHRLTAKAVEHLPEGRHLDGAGLWLVKRNVAHGKWIFRFTLFGKRREMGLGSFPLVSLAAARRAAEEARPLIRAGRDPIRVRAKERREEERNLVKLKDVAEACFEARKAELRGDGKAGRWYSPIRLYVLPRIGDLSLSDIDQIVIRDCLKPIWQEKADTAQKALSRLRIILRHGAALNLDVDLDAIAKARALLGQQRHVVQNIPALAWQQVPAFYTSLNDGTITHLALRLLMLTGVRSKALRFMREAEIERDVWTIPAELVKGRKGRTSPFRVPLSREALAVLAVAQRHARNGYIFPGQRRGAVISDATMIRLMSRKGMEERPHGFRTSLRTWLSEATDTPHDVAEMMIGHLTGSTVERAYKRTDFLEERRELFERWGQYLAGRGAGHG